MKQKEKKVDLDQQASNKFVDSLVIEHIKVHMDYLEREEKMKKLRSNPLWRKLEGIK